MICLLLLQLGQQGQTASLARIREGVRAAVPGLEEQEVAGTVHRALRTLIKTRRVYYTGRGYFLVSPEQGSEPADWAQRRRRLRHLVDSSCQSEESAEGSEESPEGSGESPEGSEESPNGSKTPAAAPGWGWVWGTEGAGVSNNTSLTNVRRLSTTSLLPDSRKSHHPPSSLGCHSLERSHSLRGRQDREARGRKGGSLRLKGQQARRVLDELREGREQVDSGDLPGQPGTESDGLVKGPESENDGRARKLERKNSLLGRLFGRKKCAAASEEERAGTEAVKEILVLSAQFPPPDMHIPKVMPQRSPVTLASLRMALPASPKRHRQLPR